MFFDDDDGDFGPASGGGSKLSSLFGISSSAGGNESLTYTAPKQPKSKDNGNGTSEKSDAKASAPSVMNAVAVHAFRYVNGQYAKQGKLGMAVLGDHKYKDYKILLYVSQKQPVAAAKIHSSFNFTVQQNNYATFYDDQSQLWSICFENSSHATEFVKFICVAKFNCSPIGLLTQDLSIGEGQALQKGDTAELQYTGYLYSYHTFGKVFESNRNGEKLYKLKLGRGKVIKGWEEGIPGMKKGGKRLLIIPPGLAYGAKGAGDRIPSNATLIFEIEVTRAKFTNVDATASEESSRTASPDVTQNQPSTPDAKKTCLPKFDGGEDLDINATKETRSESVKSNREEDKKETLLTPKADTGKGRTHSISEQLSKSLEQPSGKANLLARMSKMGQSLLPSSSAKSDEQQPMEKAIESGQIVDKDGDIPTIENIKHEPESTSKPSLKPRPDHQQMPQSSTQAARQPEVSDRSEQYVHNANRPYAAHHQMSQPLAVYQPPSQMFGMNPLQSMAYGAPMTAMQIPPASNAYQSAEISLVLTEGKLHHGEMKSLVERMTERIDGLIAKVDRHDRNDKRQESNVPMIAGGIEMEASVLSSNINRILQENGKLKKENHEKTVKIESLNEKISDMLFKNQSFLEKSNLLMEERADSIKVNATHGQARINTLEQENVALSTELTSLKTRLTSFESEIEAANSRESALKAKLQKVKEEIDFTRERLDSASTNVSDHKEEIEHMKNKCKEEKQENKKLKAKLDNLEEEIQEIRQEKESTEKALAERKKKQQSDRKKFNEEIEEIKISHEEEIKSLKQRYKKGSLENEKLSALETELEVKHKENLKKALNDHERQFKEKFEDLTSEKNELQNANSLLSEKTIEMKEKEAFHRGLQQGKSETYNESVSKPAANSGNVGDEVKKVMNGVFFKLKNEFEPDETYTGRDVMKEILGTIREVTMKMTENDAKASDDENESDESDEDEEESDAAEESDADEDSEVEEDSANEGNDIETQETEVKNESISESNTESESESAGETDNIEIEGADASNNTTEEQNIQNHVSENETSQRENVDLVEEDNQAYSTSKIEGNEMNNENDSSDEELPNDGITDETLGNKDGNIEDDKKSSENGDVDEQARSGRVTESEEHEISKSEDTSSKEECLSEEEIKEEQADSALNISDPNEVSSGKSNTTVVEEENSKENIEKTTIENNEMTNNENSNISDMQDDVNQRESKDEDSEKNDASNNKFSKSGKLTTDHLFGLSDDDEDHGIFSQAVSSKKPAAAAFSRSPPPLFDDDDEDTNWI